MFNYYNSAAGISVRLRWPWWSVIAVFLVGLAFLIAQLHTQFTPHRWSVPPEDKLLRANGTFSAARAGYRSPFVFETDDGRTITLGCAPDRRTNLCLDDLLNLPELSQHEATIGYFVTDNSDAPKLANVLVTVETGGVSVLSYSEARKRLLDWGLREEQIKRSPIILILRLIGPSIVLLASVLVAVTKIRFKERDFAK